MKKIGPYPKYQFHYSQDDYQYNIQYKKNAMKPNNQQDLPDVCFIEITPNCVAKATNEFIKNLIQGIEEQKEIVFVRFSEMGGHCINLKTMKLINILNGKQRSIYFEVPQQMKIIENKITLNQQEPISKLLYSKFHWFERKNKMYKPFQLAISDTIEKLYQQFLLNGTNIFEFNWQQYRFIIDFKEETIENTTSYQINHIQRRNINQEYKEPIQKKISKGLMKIIIWQYQLFPNTYEWENYDEMNNNNLEKTYQNYCTNCKNMNTLKVNHNTSKYYIDFDKMIEYNCLTKEQRKIRRIVQEG